MPSLQDHSTRVTFSPTVSLSYLEEVGQVRMRKKEKGWKVPSSFFVGLPSLD